MGRFDFESQGDAPRTECTIRNSLPLRTPQLRNDLVYPHDGRWRMASTISHGVLPRAGISSISVFKYWDQQQKK